MAPEPKAVHLEVLYPVVRVRTKQAGGSGTVLWSEKVDGEFVTFVLTNQHVIDSAVTVKKKWNPFLGREMKTETRSTVSVEFFRYKHGSRNVGTYSVDADIMAYEEDQDLALLRLRNVERAEFIAMLPPVGKEAEIQIFDQVYAVGAALGHPPIATSGKICYMDDEMDDFEYWLSDAQIIFGNSGGAVFLADSHEFIGVPSRLAVAQIGWSADPVSHMGFFIPFWRIYDWLEDEFYHFIFDREITYEWCENERERAQEERRRLIDVHLAQDSE